MKNIMFIDDAPNCAYDIFAVEDYIFEFLFPKKGQNIEFLEDAFERLSQSQVDEVCSVFKDFPQVKSLALGIHGILFFDLKDKKSKFYPNKLDSDLDGWARGWISDPNKSPVNTKEFMSKIMRDNA
jgi:hypothetical protein